MHNFTDFLHLSLRNRNPFDRLLPLPVDTLFHIIFEKFRLESLKEVATGVAVVAVAAHRIDLQFRVSDYFLFVTLACGGAIYLSVYLVLTAVSFWPEDRARVVPPAFNMLNFGRYPLTICSLFIRFPLSWIIPLGFASFYPTTHFLGRRSFTPYFHLAPEAAEAFLLLAVFAWNKGVENFGSTGS